MKLKRQEGEANNNDWAKKGPSAGYVEEYRAELGATREILYYKTRGTVQNLGSSRSR